jgi:protein-disulfide isomerase
LVFSVVDKAKARFPELEVRECNLAEHPELGPRYGVMATPAIVVNGRLEFRSLPNTTVL